MIALTFCSTYFPLLLHKGLSFSRDVDSQRCARSRARRFTFTLGNQLEKQTDLLLRMHELVIKFDLRPCVRSTYLRVAFQSSNSNALRLTVDRNVTLIDERPTPPGSWCLSDDAVISTSMIAKVPFSVFEIKLAGREMPDSMLNLIENGVIIEAAKFSKFLTGAAAFCKDRVQTLPYWADHPSFALVFGNPVAKAEKVDGSSTAAARTSRSKRFADRNQVPATLLLPRQLPKSDGIGIHFRESTECFAVSTTEERQECFASRDEEGYQWKAVLYLVALCKS